MWLDGAPVLHMWSLELRCSKAVRFGGVLGGAAADGVPLPAVTGRLSGARSAPLHDAYIAAVSVGITRFEDNGFVVRGVGAAKSGGALCSTCALAILIVIFRRHNRRRASRDSPPTHVQVRRNAVVWP